MSNRFLQVFAKKGKRGGYTVEIHGQGYSVKLLRTLFDALEHHAELHDDLLVTFPVLRELEDPKLMARLDRDLADIKSGKVKTIPWEEFAAKLNAKRKASAPCRRTTSRSRKS